MAKKINYNGFVFEYDSYKSEEIISDCFEVVLIKDNEKKATLMLTKKQVELL